MTQHKQHTARKDSYTAAMATAGLHLLAVCLALIFVLDSPIRIDRAVYLDLSETPRGKERQRFPETEGRKTVQRRPGRVTPATEIQENMSQNEPETHSLPVTAAVATSTDSVRHAPESVRERFIKGKLSEISEEEAFEELQRLLQEYPEYKGLVVEKMLAGKSMPESPDFFVDLGIRDYLEHLDVRTKYEYEAMRQSHLFGTYYDPVNGPNGYKKGGVQVNVIELASWLYGLLGIRK